MAKRTKKNVEVVVVEEQVAAEVAVEVTPEVTEVAMEQVTPEVTCEDNNNEVTEVACEDNTVEETEVAEVYQPTAAEVKVQLDKEEASINRQYRKLIRKLHLQNLKTMFTHKILKHATMAVHDRSAESELNINGEVQKWVTSLQDGEWMTAKV